MNQKGSYPAIHKRNAHFNSRVNVNSLGINGLPFET